MFCLKLGCRCFASLRSSICRTPTVQSSQGLQLVPGQMLTSQQHFLNHWTLSGSRDTVGVVGTTSNGVMYLSMPVLFAALSRRWAHLRRTAAFCGVLLACVGFFASSWSTAAGHLVLTQGILAALGCALGTYDANFNLDFGCPSCDRVPEPFVLLVQRSVS